MPDMVPAVGDIPRLVAEEGELHERAQEMRLKIMCAASAGAAATIPVLQMAAVELELARDLRRELLARARRVHRVGLG